MKTTIYEFPVKTIYELSEGAYAPTKAHEYDAGFDIRTPKDVIVPANGSAVIDTGVRVLIPNGYVGMLKSKSGLNCKNGIVSEGVIDAGYTGTIVAKLYNNSPYDKEFKAGDKITQLVFLECPRFILVEGDVQTLKTSRGNNGFGSTGR